MSVPSIREGLVLPGHGREMQRLAALEGGEQADRILFEPAQFAFVMDAFALGVQEWSFDVNAEHPPAPKAAGLLRRDPRSVERKKFGKKKARRSFQFSKR